MWSRSYKCCIECGTTDRPHYGKGLCYRCYNRKKYHENPEPGKARASKYYDKNKDIVKQNSAKRYHENKDLLNAYMKQQREEKWFDGIREEILERDNYTCQICGKPGNIVHHKDNNGRNSTDPNNDPNNLITLCRPCHCIEHKPRFGTGKR